MSSDIQTPAHFINHKFRPDKHTLKRLSNTPHELISFGDDSDIDNESGGDSNDSCLQSCDVEGYSGNSTNVDTVESTGVTLLVSKRMIQYN